MRKIRFYITKSSPEKTITYALPLNPNGTKDLL